MSSLDTLGLALGSRCEGQCWCRVWADQDARQLCLALLLLLQNVLAVSDTSNKCAIILELEGRYLGLELQVFCDVLADLFGNWAGFLCGLVDNDKGAWLGDFEVDALAVRGVSTSVLVSTESLDMPKRTEGPALRKSRLPQARP